MTNYSSITVRIELLESNVTIKNVTMYVLLHTYICCLNIIVVLTSKVVSINFEEHSKAILSPN